MRFKTGKDCSAGVLILILIGMIACQQNKKISSPEPIRFAYQNRIGSAIPIIAIEKKLFKKEGLWIEPFRFSSGPACAEALVTGSADVATMGDTTAIYVVSRYADQRIFVSHSTGEHRHRIIVKKDAPYQSIEDLQGRRIGVKKGTSTHGGLLAMLRFHGISTDKIQLVDLNLNTMPEALMAGSIHALVASEPTPSTAEWKGGRELSSLGGLGNEYPIVMLSDSSYLKKNEKEISLFIKALMAAERFIRTHPQETAQILTKITGLPVVVAKKAMERHTYQLRLDSQIKASLQMTARFLKNENKITISPPWTKVLDTSHFN